MTRTAIESATALADGSLTSEVMVAACLDRIGTENPTIRAFSSLRDRETLLAEARAIDAARAAGTETRPFAGIPIAIKDNIAMAGEPMTCSSKMLEQYQSPFTATAVQRLIDAGLIVIGRTLMDEFGFGSSSENSAFDVPRNPVDPSRIAGGSSGGSAAAVAAGFVPWALGSDTGGSVRQPASLCGIAGFRPTYGRVSRWGLAAYASSMDTIGSLATNARDAAALSRMIEGYDENDATSIGTDANRAFDDPARLGLLEAFLAEPCQSPVADAVRRAAETAKGLGHALATARVARHDDELAAYYVIASVEAASNLARYDGVRYGHRSAAGGLWDEVVTKSRSEAFGDEVKRRVMLGTFAASAGYADQLYDRACRARRLIRDEYLALFERFDVLIAPVAPTTAWKLGEKARDPVEMYQSDVLSVSAALAGLPAVVIPCGADDAGLSIGVQLTGPPHSDHALLAFAASLEPAIASNGS